MCGYAERRIYFFFFSSFLFFTSAASQRSNCGTDSRKRAPAPELISRDSRTRSSSLRRCSTTTMEGRSTRALAVRGCSYKAANSPKVELASQTVRHCP
ncbi:hypothetical protein T492DRAFT_351599 [Pavlovales sp. CCMP2436]|nr:hypothetical protein T492DRAFT_351599 [Pavlovales sp. CCMP2436]